MKSADDAIDITLELYNGDYDSVIFLRDKSGILGRIYYTRRIHKFESKGDFDLLNTELQTYGYSQGLLPLWEYLRVKRGNQ